MIEVEQNQRLHLDHVLALLPDGHWDQRTLAINAWNDYALAYKKFIEKNSDETMIDMIGRYAYFSRVLRDLNDKYGAK